MINMNFRFILFIVFLLLLISIGLKNNNLEWLNAFAASAEKVSIEEKAAQVKELCNEKNKSKNIGKMSCYSEEFQNIAYKNGPDYAFEVLFALQKKDSTARICHLIAHGIGWGTYERNPDDWQNQIASINPTCVYGGIHGILEQYIYDLPEGNLTKEVIPNICKANPSPACIHAVGHLTTVEAQDDLDKAIELCSAFPKAKRKRHYCLTGTFMEHMIAENLVEHGYYPQSRRKNWYRLIDDFEKLCRSYNGENATACWTEIVHASAIKFRGNPKKIFDFCNAFHVQEGAKRCKRHAITEIISKHDYNISSIKYMCAIEQPNDPSFERDCYVNLVALKFFHISPKEAVDIIDFCLSLDSKFHNSCFSQMGKMFRKLSVSKDEIFEICQNVPVKFKSKCMES